MDLITYTPDIIKLRIDIAEIANSNDDHPAKSICSSADDIIKLLLTKIPTVKKENLSVSLVRNVTEDVIESIPSMEVIGWMDGGEYKFKPYGQDKYESVYNVQQQTYADEGGEIQYYTPPYMMGVFA